MKFGFYTLGCKVNLFETQALMQQARTRGHEICTHDADAFIINTCSVTAMSDRKNLRAFHKIRRDNPRAIIAACGCFAQTEPSILEASGEIDLVCGTSARSEVIPLCEQVIAGKRPTDLNRFRTPNSDYEILPAGIPDGRTRALLKVEDGCDNYCTYCIIPYARGHVRSLPMDTAIEQAQRLAKDGVHEIVVTGIEISSYGRDLPEHPNLVLLIQQLCQAVPHTYLRLGSLEPRTIDESFCNILAPFSNLRPHFHLSLQSGCNRTLARMKRRYTTESFSSCCTQLRQVFADCSITADVIVGFPGETEQDFIETLEFIEHCQFSDLHIFPYSPRPGTPAASMPDQVDESEKSRRAMIAKKIAAQLNYQYRTKFIGRTLEVLFEHPTVGETWSGHSAYCFPVQATHPSIYKNGLFMVHITGLTDDGLMGEVIEQPIGGGEK